MGFKLFKLLNFSFSLTCHKKLYKFIETKFSILLVLMNFHFPSKKGLIRN